ncbi:MAG TPA: lipase family protein [Chitinophagales bacterium]|nr:lipase family protein [Chitinophagales bacterium]
MVRWFLLSISLLLIFSCKKGSEIQQSLFTSSTLESYRFVQQLSAQQISNLIDTTGASTGIACIYPVNIYEVTYRTTNYKDEACLAKGIICFPVISRMLIPVISLQHGAIFSKYNIKADTTEDIFNMAALLCSESGAAVCVPYYIGIGDVTATHHFFNAKEETNAVIDITRTLTDLSAKTNSAVTIMNELILAGYSQGAHASLATLNKIERLYSRDFNVKLTILISGIYSFKASQQLSYITDSAAYTYTSVFPYLIRSIQETKQLYPYYSSYLKHPYDSLCSSVFSSHLPEDTILTRFPLYATNMLQPDFRNELQTNPQHPFWNALFENDLLNNPNPITPIYFYYSAADEVAKPQNSTLAYNQFRTTNNNVYIENVGNVSHLTSCFAGLKRMRRWVYKQVKLIPY